MPVLPCSLALRMSAVLRTGITRSLLSRISLLLATILFTVAWKPSHTDTVQLAAVRPPLRMSSNSSRFHLAMIRPSMTMLSACNSAGLIWHTPFRLGAPGLVPTLWGQHIVGARRDPARKRPGSCRKRQACDRNDGGQCRGWNRRWPPGAGNGECARPCRRGFRGRVRRATDGCAAGAPANSRWSSRIGRSLMLA